MDDLRHLQLLCAGELDEENKRRLRHHVNSRACRQPVLDRMNAAATAQPGSTGRAKAAATSEPLTIFPGPYGPQSPLGQLGSYGLVEQLGRGTFGTVYLAYDGERQREVALKVLSSQQGAIRQEAGKSALHPNVVSILSIGRHAGFEYCAMELVKGPTLDKHAIANIEHAVRIASQIAAGLKALHAKGTLHRDIKPNNILISGEQVKIADFGVALSRAEVPDETVVGVPPYASPKQLVAPRSVDLTTDLYSVGVVLYELVARVVGARPFHSNRKELKENRWPPLPKPLRDIDKSIPLDLESLIEKCVARRPERRYQTADQLERALRCLLERNPTAACRSTP